MKPNNLRLLCLTLLLMTGVSGLHAAVDYLCFTAESASSIKLSMTGSITAEVKTSTDGVTWTDYTFDTDINLGAGEKVYFKGNYRGTATNNFAKFVMSGQISASGNIMTLTDGDNPTLSLEGKKYCFYSLFSGCESLTSAPTLPAETLAANCYASMFYYCTELSEAPALPATALAKGCYMEMFKGCTGLTAAPALPAETMADICYANMFEGCTKLTVAPNLPATTLAMGCYNFMFSNCTGLEAAPDLLPAATLEEQCYEGMFAGCTNLTTAPALSATQMARHCCDRMFEGCTALTAAPELPATNLAEGCYCWMFWNCTGLETAPALPATTLAEYCYEGMFEGCTGLKRAPALPATTLTKSCYYKMFRDCTGLETAPELPAATLAETCYKEMFCGCTNLNAIEVNFSSWTDADNTTLDWVKDVSATGTFVCPEALNVSERNSSRVPAGWTVNSSTGINSPVMDSRSANGATYNILGQKVDENYKGIVIQNGKKHINR
ncbi:MAG: leucine-rich repeat protein [Bacteroidaceae bacterium]